MKLFPHQSDVIRQNAALMNEGKKRILTVMPCRTGKTVVFSHLSVVGKNKGRKTVILTHRSELLTQGCNTLDKFGASYGIVKSGYTPKSYEAIQVCSTGTLVNRLDWAQFAQGCNLIVDEAHHCTAATYDKIIQVLQPEYIFGFTATPIRTDGTGLGTVFDAMVQGISTREAIKQGFLCKPVIYDCSKVGDMSKVAKSRGDYTGDAAAEKMNKPTITGDAVTEYTKHCAGMPAIAFCCNIKHAEDVAEAFRAAGYRSAAVSGKTPTALRKELLTGLGTGEIDVITSCELIGEGFDVPAVVCSILLRPTMSLSVYIQQASRCTTKMEGKRRGIVLDHAGNRARFGAFYADFEWSLDGQKKVRVKKASAEETIALKRCAECFACFEPEEAEEGCCPECGVELPTGGRKIRTVAGELINVTDDFDALPKTADELAEEKEWQRVELARAADKAKREKAELKAAAEQLEREKSREINAARTEEELKEVAKKYGFKSGWIEHKLNGRAIAAKKRGY